MLDINRWDPFQEMVSLREAMNRLMEDSFLLPSRTLGNTGQEGGQGATRGTRQLGAPAVDIQEQDDAYMLRVALPGVRQDDVRIETRGNQVVISGQVREEQERERGNYLLRERRVGQFYRAFTLPSEVNPEGAEATYAQRHPDIEAAQERSKPLAPDSHSGGGTAAPGGWANPDAWSRSRPGPGATAGPAVLGPGPATNARPGPGAVADTGTRPGPITIAGARPGTSTGPGAGTAPAAELVSRRTSPSSLPGAGSRDESLAFDPGSFFVLAAAAFCWLLLWRVFS